MATVYLPSCPDLPTHRPYGFPHIVEGGDELHYALEQGLRLHVADGAATVLFNHSPETLKALLDIRCDSFSFVRYSGPNERIADLYIERHVDVVTCGYYFSRYDTWDFKYVYGISALGRWIPISRIGILSAPLVATDDKVRDDNDEQTMGCYGKLFASSVILNELWKEESGAKITISRGKGTIKGEASWA